MKPTGSSGAGAVLMRPSVRARPTPSARCSVRTVTLPRGASDQHKQTMAGSHCPLTP
jgi:hypothetical protein